MIINATCILKGNNIEERFTSICNIRENKQIIKVILNKVYEKLLITSIKPKYKNSEDLEFDISFENLFIAQFKRTTKQVERDYSLLTSGIPLKSNVPKEFSFVEIKKPITVEQKPYYTLTEYMKDSENIGLVGAIKNNAVPKSLLESGWYAR